MATDLLWDCTTLQVLPPSNDQSGACGPTDACAGARMVCSGPGFKAEARDIFHDLMRSTTASNPKATPETASRPKPDALHGLAQLPPPPGASSSPSLPQGVFGGPEATRFLTRAAAASSAAGAATAASICSVDAAAAACSSSGDAGGSCPIGSIDASASLGSMMLTMLEQYESRRFLSRGLLLGSILDRLRLLLLGFAFAIFLARSSWLRHLLGSSWPSRRMRCGASAPSPGGAAPLSEKKAGDFSNCARMILVAAAPGRRRTAGTTSHRRMWGNRAAGTQWFMHTGRSPHGSKPCWTKGATGIDVRMYVRTCVRTVCMYVYLRTYVRTHVRYVRTYVRTYVCTCVCVCVCMCVCVLISAHVCAR